MLNQPKIIFLFPYSLTAFDAVKFGFDLLLARGVDLQVFDMSALVSARNDKNAVFLKLDYIKKIHSYTELETEIKNTRDSSVFIDNINGINGFQWQGREIFKLFKQYQVEYYVVEVGALPIFTPLTPKTLYSKFKKIFQGKILLAYLKSRLGKLIVYLQWKYLQTYQLPAKIYIGDSESKQRYIKKYNFNSANIYSIHSFDYDRYLTFVRTPQPLLFPREKICVFLDQMLATHCDFGTGTSFSPVTAENYLPALNHFFDYLETQIDMKIIIAASPRAAYEKQAQIFGTRQIISGKSIELVAESVLVLAHTTTALSLAVLFDKPVLIIKTREMKRATGFANFLDNLSASLNLVPLCIDDDVLLKKFDFKAYLDHSRNFDNYKYKYVMSKNTQDKLTWEILTDTWMQPKKLTSLTSGVQV
jgi:hypothetical protein